MAQTQTFTDVQPIQQQQTFSNVTPIDQQQSQSAPSGLGDQVVQWLHDTFAPRQVPQQKPTGEMPGSFEGHPENVGEYIPRTAGEMAGGVKDIAHGDIAKGAHRVISGAGEAVAPVALPFAAAAAPAATAVALGTGAVGQTVGKEGAKALGASEDQSDLAGDITGLAAGYGSSKLPVGRVAGVAGKVVKGVAEDIPGVRQAGKIAQYWKETAPPEGKPLISREPLGPETPDPDLLKARSLTTANTPAAQPASQTGEALGQVPQRGAIAKAVETPEAQPAAQPIRRGSLAQMLQDQLDQSLGAKKLDPTKPLRNQLDTLSGSKPAADLPEGHTPVQSSALRSYKYDPDAQEFHARYSSGDATTHVFGDVAPEEAQAFGEADSKGKAMQQIKQGHPLVAKIVNGKRIPTRAISEQK